MVKIQDNMSLHDETVQQLGDIKVPRPRRERRKREHPVDTEVQTKRKSSREQAKLFQHVHEGVYDTAMNIADQNWRRLEVIDSTTIIVHNNEVH
jgi:hypothetical protein